MTYSGVVKNGVVELEGPEKLPDGQRVEVTPVTATTGDTTLPAFGLWRDRTDISDSADASRKLREQIERRQA
jgi:hypothetical protein